MRSYKKKYTDDATGGGYDCAVIGAVSPNLLNNNGNDGSDGNDGIFPYSDMGTLLSRVAAFLRRYPSFYYLRSQVLP